MDAFLSDDKKQKRKNKKEKKSKEKERDAAGIPHTELTPFPPPNIQLQQQPTAPWVPNPPSAPWMSSGASSIGGDGESSIFSAASSITVTPRGRSDTRENTGYETDAASGGRSKSRTGKLRKRSKSRAGKKGGGDAGGYETDDGYVSSGPAGEKAIKKSKSRFFKLPNRSKSHVPSDDEQEPIPPPPPLPNSGVTQSPQPQFRLPIAARFATTLGNLNTGETLIEPPITRANSPDKEKSRPLGNGSLDFGRPDSVDFTTAMSRALASASASETPPANAKPAPTVHFQVPSQGSISTSASSSSASTTSTFTPAAAPSSYHPAREASDTSTRYSAGSVTSSSEHHGSSSASSSAFHSSSSSHGRPSTAPSSAPSSSTSTSPPTNLFSRFGSKRVPGGDRKDKDKESEEYQQQTQRTQISYPITRAPSSAPGSGPASLSRQTSPPTINTTGLAPNTTVPSSYSPASASTPGSGRIPSASKGNGHSPRPLFIHRVPSSEKGLGGRAETSATPSPISPNIPSTASRPLSPKAKPTPATLVIPTNPSSSAQSKISSPSPSPIPSASYIVPSPSEPIFSATATSGPASSSSPPSSSAAPSSFNPLATVRRLRSRASEENLSVRTRTRTSEDNVPSNTGSKGTTRTRVSEDTFILPPPPQVFTIPPATPPPSSPLPKVPQSQQGQGQGQSVFAAQQQQQRQQHLGAPSPSGGTPSSSAPSSPMRGRSSPFPSKPASVRKPESGNDKRDGSGMDLDGFGGRVKVKRYAELYGWQGQGQEDEDDTVTTSSSSSRLPLRRDDERERERGRAGGLSKGDWERRALPAGLHIPTKSESEGWKRHRPRQSTQVGINVEEPSDIEDEGYGGEVYEDDDGARYYGSRGGISDDGHGHRGYDAPALDRRNSYEALHKRFRDPQNLVGRRRSEEEDEIEEEGLPYTQAFSEDGHSRSVTTAQRRFGLPRSPSPQPPIGLSSRSRSRSEDDHIPVYQPQRQQRRGAMQIQQISVPPSPAASDDSHYSANGRFTMYEDDERDLDYSARNTMYSEAPSFLDESRSRSARNRFLERVEGMYDDTGRERERVPPVPSTYLATSGRTSPNPGYAPTKSSMVNNRLAGLAGKGVGRGGRSVSPVPPVPNLPRGAVVGIIGDDGGVVTSSKVWI